jgi:hypothetical protein
MLLKFDHYDLASSEVSHYGSLIGWLDSRKEFKKIK